MQTNMGALRAAVHPEALVAALCQSCHKRKDLKGRNAISLSQWSLHKLTQFSVMSLQSVLFQRQVAGGKINIWQQTKDK